MRSNLARQPNSLCLTTRQGGASTRECQVIQAHIQQKTESIIDLFDDQHGNLGVAFVQFETLEERHRLIDRHCAHFRNAPLRNSNSQNFWA